MGAAIFRRTCLLTDGLMKMNDYEYRNVVRPL